MYLSIISKPFRTIKHPTLLNQFYLNNFVKLGLCKLTKKNLYLEKAKRLKKAAGRPFVNNDAFNEILKEKLNSTEPFFCCRYGSNELSSYFYGLLKKLGILDNVPPKCIRQLKYSSGVFPEKEETFLQFSEEYIKALGNADLNAYWGSVLMEEHMIAHSMSKTCVQYAKRALEPFQYQEPWTVALGGKKVLIVHPFSELIKQQYQRINEIFPGKKILPDFDLNVVKAIQSSGTATPEEYTDWVNALDSLFNQCIGKTFDVALLGCGSYAVPLGSRLKNAGKQAIVLGGMMQLLFGIKGARWEASRSDIVAMYNEAWVRAGEKYLVKGADKIGDGPAYW